jgi:O-succinylbenzoate synthase
MKIESVELIHVELPLKAPFETSFGTSVSRQVILVKVEAEGVTGWGEVSALEGPYYNAETTETAWHVLREFAIPLVLGRTVSHPSDVFRALDVIKGHHFAKAGLENAIWDAYAKSQGVPLRAVLGGDRDRIGVGVSIGIQQTPAHLVDTVGRFLDAGYQRMKIKIKPGRDVEDLQAARQAFPDALIMADANNAYSLADIDTFRALDELNLMMYEQPLAWDDIVDHATLQAAVKTPVCLDESIHTVDDTRKALALDACRIINIKVGRVAGLTSAKAIHDYMHERGLPVWGGGMLETGVGRAINIHMATLPGFTMPGDTSAFDRYYHEDIVDQPAVLNADGTITVPTGPGIGVHVLSDRVERLTLRRHAVRHSA